MRITVSILVYLFAGSASAQTASLEERAQRSTSQINEIGKLERSHGYYETSTREYYLGTQGVNPLAEAWLADSYAWLRDMQQLTSILDAADERSFVSAVAEVERTYQAKGVALADLASRAAAIEAAAKRGQELLERSRAVPAPASTDFDPVMTLLLESRDTATGAFVKIATSIRQRLADLERIQRDSRPLLIGRLKRAMVTAGLEHLQKRLDEAAATLLYIERAVPLLAQLESLELTMGRHASDLAYHQAQDTLALSEAACQAFAAQLGAVGLPPHLERRALDRKTVVCDGIRGHWTDLVDLGQSPARLVHEYAKVQAAAYRAACQTDRPTVNCEKIAVLRSIPLATLQSMPADRLRFFEYAWSKTNVSL